MICKHCAAEIPDGAIFCPACGQPAAEQRRDPTPAQFCPQCGAGIPAGGAFCPACGGNLNRPAPVPRDLYGRAPYGQAPWGQPRTKDKLAALPLWLCAAGVLLWVVYEVIWYLTYQEYIISIDWISITFALVGQFAAFVIPILYFRAARHKLGQPAVRSLMIACIVVLAIQILAMLAAFFVTSGGYFRYIFVLIPGSCALSEFRWMFTVYHGYNFAVGIPYVLKELCFLSSSVFCLIGLVKLNKKPRYPYY